MYSIIFGDNVDLHNVGFDKLFWVRGPVVIFIVDNNSFYNVDSLNVANSGQGIVQNKICWVHIP